VKTQAADALDSLMLAAVVGKVSQRIIYEPHTLPAATGQLEFPRRPSSRRSAFQAEREISRTEVPCQGRSLGPLEKTRAFGMTPRENAVRNSN
jgi:hypothetical protein